MMAQSVTFWAAATCYAIATAAFFVNLAFRREWGARAGLWFAAIGLAPHAVAIGLRWAQVGHGPYSSRYEVLSANAFVLVGALLVTTAFARDMRGLGAFAMPVAFLLMGWAVSSFGVAGEVPVIFKSYWLFLHIAFAKLFGASIVLATCCAGAYLVKDRNPLRLERLPAPARLDLYSHQFLLIAFLFLGVMIVAGSLWAHQSWGRYWGWDPIETSSLATWLVMGIILHFRVLHHWSGRRMAWLCFVAFACSMLTLYVVALVVPTIHDSYMVGR
jgi:cytochrome c-type biogenesis protein CcsB